MTGVSCWRERCQVVGKLTRVPLREVWQHEALGFTVWLRENLEVLNEVTGLSLTSAENEQTAGDFRVDLVAEDAEGRTIVIENQLERSDHDHLGKLVTYVSALNAAAAIWIVAAPRAEHTTAITWLNQAGAASFYLILAEAVRIGESPPAPLLTVIVRPSEEGLAIGKVKKEQSERHQLRRRFWTMLLELAKQKTKLHSSISPSDSSFIGTGAGRSGLGYYYVVGMHESRVEVYIDRGKDADEANQAIFDALKVSREAIDSRSGEPLDWQDLDGRRAFRIASHLQGGYRDDEEQWPEVCDRMIDAMIRLEATFAPHIAKLPS